MKKIIDISWPVTNEITEYKDKKTVMLEPIIREDVYVRETMICMKSHTGTHIDAPAHFLRDGKTLDQLPLDSTSGPCIVLDLTSTRDAITKHDLEKFEIKENDIVLLKTKNSWLTQTAPFEFNFIYLEKSGAEYLASKKIKAVGIDYLGIERGQPDHETHKAFMEHDMPIIEGLRLKEVLAGSYFLWCLPLSIEGVDGVPARAILVEQ